MRDPWSSSPETRLPTFLIVGAMKCGTTSLAAWLREHPDVFLPRQKELHFFTQHWALGQDWYASHFRDAGTARALGEATPTYMIDQDVLRRIHGFLPGVKLIVMVREPVERAYSHHKHWRRKGERRSFAEAVADERQAGRPAAEIKWDPERPEGYRYLAPGRYAEQLEAMASIFPRDHILVVFMEDLQRDPEGTFRSVCDFLGVSADVVPANVGKAENVAVVLGPPWLFRLLLTIRFGAWAPKWLGRWLFKRMARPDDVSEPLPEALRIDLREGFAADNAAFAEWLGRELPASWSLPPRV